MKLLHQDQKVQANIELKDALKQFEKVFYGLKHYVWKMRNRSAIVKRHKESGVFSEFVIAKGKRQEDGSYSRDEVDWNNYNLFAWNEYSEDFHAKAGLPEDAKTIKDIGEKKRELIMYFLEHYGDGVDLKIDRTPLRGTVKSNEGITISHKNGVFTVKSPSGTLSIVINQSQALEMVNHTKNENIVFPPKAVDLFQEMLRIAELIHKNPEETLENPYCYLEIDPEMGRLIRSAQEFLIKENEEHMAKVNARNEAKKEKQLTHENYAKKQVTVNLRTKRETIDEKKADAQAYPCDHFQVLGNGNHYYGIDAKTYLDWLTKDEISAKYHQWYIKTDIKLENVLGIAHYEEITTIDTEFDTTHYNFDKTSLILWITEDEYQVFYNATK